MNGRTEDSIMRGRHPAGPEYVSKLQGSTTAKERLQLILETMVEDCRVSEACRRLGIGPVRFHVLRREAMQAAMDRLEARSVGRPPRVEPGSAARIRELEEEVQRLQIEVRAARTREEIALVLPCRTEGTPPAEKKTTRRTRRTQPGRQKKGTSTV
jgi:transposase-like protein